MGGFDLSGAIRGGVEGLLSSLPEGAKFVQALRSAAEQQAQLAERKRQFDIEQGMRDREFTANQQQRDLQNQMAISDRGGQPIDASGNYSRTVTPTPALGMNPFTMDVPAGANDTVLSSGGKKYRMPTQQERDEQDLGRKVNEAKAVEDAKRFNLTLPDKLGEILGIPHGSTVTVEHAPTAADYSTMGERITQQQNADTKADGKGTKTPGHWATNEETGAVSYVEPGDDGKLKVTSTGPGVGKTRAPKGDGGDKPASPAQLRMVRSKFDTTLADSKKQLEKDLKDGALSSDGVREAYRDHIGRMQDAQKAYESELSTLLGKDVGHNDWADRQMDEWDKHNAAQAPAAGAGRGGAAPAKQAQQNAPQYKKGDTVSYQGKPHKVTAIENGKLVLQPIGQEAAGGK